MSEDTASEDATKLFQSGTWIGRTFDEIEASGIFGERTTERTRTGSWGVPHRLDYRGAIGSNNPYETHIGFTNDRKAVYVLFLKRRGETINVAEMTGLLHKVASGGNWALKGEGHQPRVIRPDEDNTPPGGNTGTDFAGTFYEYIHKTDTEIFRLFAYRIHNRKQLLIWAPIVTPDLSGASAAPDAVLELAPDPGGADDSGIAPDPDILEDSEVEEEPEEFDRSSDPFAKKS